MVVSVALSTAGGLAHSCASHLNAVWPAYSVKTGMTLLSSVSAVHAVDRGTYSMNPVVVVPVGADGTL
jgi:hypothetical protein